MLRIVCANVGYLRAIDGSFRQHVGRLHHHFSTPLSIQEECLRLLTERLEALDPDLCCLLEVDRGSITNRFFDQISKIATGLFEMTDARSKYGAGRRLHRLHHSLGKYSALFAKRSVAAKARYMLEGRKKLVFDVDLDGLRIIFVHLSLARRTRRRQIAELASWVEEGDLPTIVVGDFNIFRGEPELEPLLEHLDYVNRGMTPSFRFGPYRAALDVCLASRSLRERIGIELIEQPYSDHRMLVIDIRD